jgi:hypothetical protein
VTRDRRSLRRLLGWALVAGLSTAALAAVVALLTGSFDETEVRVILTSVGFAVSSSTAAAGAAQRFRSSGALRTLGGGTVAASGAAFALLVVGLWVDDDSETVWRTVGCAGVLAFAGAHTCLVLGARRPSDSNLVRGLVVCSVALGLIDTLAGIAAISGLIDEVDEGLARVLGASLVLFVVSSVLPPILRRLQLATESRGSAVVASEPPSAARQDALELLTSELVGIADRIDELNSSPTLRAPEIRREVERLRQLADTFRR